MRYFHCPAVYNGKPYGCGRGPYNATQAYLDLNMTCPLDGKRLRPYHKVTRGRVTTERCAVRGVDGRPYCDAAPYDGAYCRRHAYLAHSDTPFVL